MWFHYSRSLLPTEFMYLLSAMLRGWILVDSSYSSSVFTCKCTRHVDGARCGVRLDGRIVIGPKPKPKLPNWRTDFHNLNGAVWKVVRNFASSSRRSGELRNSTTVMNGESNVERKRWRRRRRELSVSDCNNYDWCRLSQRERPPCRAEPHRAAPRRAPLRDPFRSHIGLPEFRKVDRKQ